MRASTATTLAVFVGPVAAACNDGGGCAEAPAEVTDATLTVSPAIVTVATLSWTTDVPRRGRVRYGTAERELVTTLEAAEATEHSTLLVGVPAASEIAWAIEDEGGIELTAGVWTTEALPGELPPIAVEGGTAQQFMVTTVLGIVTAVVILSPEGRVVWYHIDDSGLDTVRALVAADGNGILYTVGDVSGEPSADSLLRRVSWDGTEVSDIAVPYLAQDFAQHFDGTIAAVTAEVRAGTDGEPIKGNEIVEIQPDGSFESVWSSWDCFDPAVTLSNDPGLGWTWVNAIDVLDWDYVLSVRNFSSIVWVARETGACGPILGGELSTYDFVGERFLHTHQFHVWDDHMLVFDNDGAGGNRSRVLEYVLTDTTATQVWEYLPDPPAFSFVLGDVTRLDDGSTFAAFSLAGQLDRVDEAGELQFRASTPLGYAFGYVTLVPNLAR